MRLCELCAICKNEQREDCFFRPYKVKDVYEVKGKERPLNTYTWHWECADFCVKQELCERI